MGDIDWIDLSPSGLGVDFVLNPLSGSVSKKLDLSFFLDGLDGITLPQTIMPFIQASSPLKPIKNISLLAHQKEAVTWMHKREESCEYGISGGILSDHMGLGKTFSIMGCIHYGAGGSNNLIIVPLAMIGTWVNTFKEYNFSVYSLNKNGGFIRHSYGVNSVYIIHYNAVVKMSRELRSVAWTRIIIDEAHTIRNAKSVIFQHLMTFKAASKWIVTATPLINSIKDIINLFKWLGYAYTGGLLRFIEIYKSELMEKFVLRRTVKDIPALTGNIADVNIREVHVPLNLIEEDLYQSIISSAAPSLLALLSEEREDEGDDVCENDDDGENDGIEKSLAEESEELSPAVQEEKAEVVHDSSLELIHSLHYLSISPSLLTPYIDYTDSSKLMKMVEIMEGFRNENKSTIVFCQFRKEIELAKTILVDCGVCCKKNVFVLDGSFSSMEREKVLANMKERVEDGEFVVLLLQLKSGACGLNLQYFGAVVFINKWWNQPIIDQAIGRVVRIGSTGVKEIVFLVGERGYDVLVNNVLQRKAMASGGI